MSMTIESPVAGVVIAIEAVAGSTVEIGNAVLVIESMKMEIPVESEVAGTVRQVLVAVGDTVAEGQALVQIQPV